MPSHGRRLATLSAVLLLVACGGASPDGDVPSPGAEPEAGVSSAGADTLRLRVEAPEQVPAGEPVPVTFRVENVSGRTLDLYLRGRTIAFDLVVSAPDGSVVWRRLEGEVVPAILRIETLEPEDVLQLSDVWDQRSAAGERVPPGRYTLRGELLTEDDPLATPERPLEIGPR